MECLPTLPHYRCYLLSIFSPRSPQESSECESLIRCEAEARATQRGRAVLPPLPQVLEELELSPYLRDFVRMGVAESRLLLKLGAMDFQTMRMDWAGFSEDELERLRRKIDELYRLARVPEEESRPELELRKKLTYGRVYVPQGVQSFEYCTRSRSLAVRRPWARSRSRSLALPLTTSATPPARRTTRTRWSSCSAATARFCTRR